MLGLTTKYAPPDAVPATTRMSPFVFWYALIAGLGPTNEASIAPASSAVVASLPELNVFSSSLTFEPSFVWNDPFWTPMMAGACVTFGKYPSRSVTLAFEPPPLEDLLFELLPHAARASESANCDGDGGDDASPGQRSSGPNLHG